MHKRKPIVIALKGKKHYQRLLSGLPQTAGLRAGLVSLKAAESVGQHSTDAKEEVIVFLKGRAIVTCANGFRRKVQAPCLVYIPPHTHHNISNAATVLLQYLYVVSPLK